MNEAEYQDLLVRVELGETLPVVDRYLFEMERRRRAAGPNVLQKMAAERRENPLLKAPMWGKAGISRP